MNAALLKALESLGIELDSEDLKILNDMEQPDTEDEPDDEDESDPDVLAQCLISCYCEKVALHHILIAMHTNTKSRNFYQDHLLFERLGNEMEGGLDRLAENIRTYGVLLPAGIKSIVELSQIEQTTTYDAYNPEGYFEYLKEAYTILLGCLYETSEIANEQCKMGSANILQDEIEMTEHHLLYFIESVG